VIVQPLTAKQRTAVALSRRHRHAIYEGSVRSSKTITSLLDWLAFVRAAPPGPLLMVGRTERTLERNVIGLLTEMLGLRRCRLVRGTGELHLLGRVVLVAGAADARAQEKIRGLTLAGAYVDEASLVPESFWSMLLTRLSVPGARLIATTNPDSPQHWLKRDYLERAQTHLTRRGDVKELGGPVDLARLSFHLEDNPTLDPAYRHHLDKTYVGLWRRRFIDGDWVAAEGAIYDMLDLGETGGGHRVLWADVRTTLTGRWWAGVDYGQSNPFHAVLLGTTIDDRLIVCGEWRYDGRAEHRQLSDPEYERRLRGWLDAGAGIPAVRDRTGVVLPTSQVWPERTAVDPSAASFRTMLRVSRLDRAGCRRQRGDRRHPQRRLAAGRPPAAVHGPPGRDAGGAVAGAGAARLRVGSEGHRPRRGRAAQGRRPRPGRAQVRRRVLPQRVAAVALGAPAGCLDQAHLHRGLAD
jgi:PBSX family phage terminase large subunit